MPTVIPLMFWMIALAGGIVFLLLLGRRDPPPRGHCPECGYDLRGLTSFRCPECGRPIER